LSRFYEIPQDLKKLNKYLSELELTDEPCLPAAAFTQLCAIKPFRTALRALVVEDTTSGADIEKIPSS
jgi:hypothetical protein